MRESLHILVSELFEISNQLMDLIRNDDLEPALELMNRRFSIIEQLKSIVEKNAEIKNDIQQELIKQNKLDDYIVGLLLSKKSKVHDELKKIARRSKASFFYGQI